MIINGGEGGLYKRGIVIRRKGGGQNPGLLKSIDTGRKVVTFIKYSGKDVVEVEEPFENFNIENLPKE